MRKALIGLILAATAMVPATASAQRHNRGGDDGDRGSWSGRSNGGQRGGGGEGRAARAEARQQQQVEVQQQQQQQVQQQVQRQRGDGGNRGGWNRGGGDNGAGERANWRGNDNAGRGQWRGDGNRAERNREQSVYPQAWQGNPNDPRLQRYRQLEQRNQNGGDYRRGGGDRRDWRNNNDRNDRNWRDGRGSNRGDWNRGWRNDNRYNWSSWRNQNRNRYHLSPYYSPYRNWSYRRFSVGLFLDSLFYDQRYWIGDPYEYRLPPAPYGTQWIRYYDDVILVDVYTGEVLDVIYDFFW